MDRGNFYTAFSFFSASSTFDLHPMSVNDNIVSLSYLWCVDFINKGM